VSSASYPFVKPCQSLFQRLCGHCCLLTWLRFATMGICASEENDVPARLGIRVCGCCLMCTGVRAAVAAGALCRGRHFSRRHPPAPVPCPCPRRGRVGRAVALCGLGSGPREPWRDGGCHRGGPRRCLAIAKTCLCSETCLGKPPNPPDTAILLSSTIGSRLLHAAATTALSSMGFQARPMYRFAH
jgi:hypothetical protein